MDTMEDWKPYIMRRRSEQRYPSGAKAHVIIGPGGTAEAVPYPERFMK